jgi:hypothetical protein
MAQHKVSRNPSTMPEWRRRFAFVYEVSGIAETSRAATNGAKRQSNPLPKIGSTPPRVMRAMKPVPDSVNHKLPSGPITMS